MIKYPHQLMLRLHLFEWLGCLFMFVNKITILNENCVRVHVRWLFDGLKEREQS